MAVFFLMMCLLLFLFIVVIALVLLFVFLFSAGDSENYKVSGYTDERLLEELVYEQQETDDSTAENKDEAYLYDDIDSGKYDDDLDLLQAEDPERFEELYGDYYDD